MPRVRGILIAFLLFTCSAGAQTAREYLASAAKSYGPWAALKTFSYEIEGRRGAGPQARIYNGREKQAYYTRKVFDYTNRLFLEESRDSLPGGITWHNTTLIRDSMVYRWDPEGSRLGKLVHQQKTRAKLLPQPLLPWHIIEEVLQSKDSLVLARETRGTRIMRFPTGKPMMVLAFDQQDQLVRVEVPQTGQRTDYTGYTAVNGYRQPSITRGYNNSGLVWEERASGWRFDLRPEPQTFILPQGYVMAKKEPAVVTKLSADLYLVERVNGDRNVLFVNMDDYVVVIEAPGSSEASAEVVRKIRELIPGKPVRYVIPTHFHPEVSGGLRQYVAEGSILVMTPATAPYVEELMVAPVADDLGRAPRQALMETFRGKREVRDTRHHFIIYEVPNSHAEGLVIVYFPEEKLIFQTDLLTIAPDGTLPAATAATRELDGFLKKTGITYTRIIGGGGHHHITPEMVQKVLAR